MTKPVRQTELENEMTNKPIQTLHDVKPVSFEQYHISEDGEQIVFTVHGKGGGVGHIAIDWLKLSLAIQLIQQAGEEAAEVRAHLGKSDDFAADEGCTAQLVKTFQVSELVDQNLKILSLQSPTGFRCDFAIPTDAVDQRGRSFPRAIAEELLSDAKTERQRPN